MVFVLARVPAGLGEPRVDERPARAGDERGHPVEDASAVRILVEPLVEEVPGQPAAL